MLDACRTIYHGIKIKSFKLLYVFSIRYISVDHSKPVILLDVGSVKIIKES